MSWLCATKRCDNFKIMSVSEDATPIGSDSFWDVGQYKRTVKRVDDGLKLCHQLMQLVRERGVIEANYAKELQKWSNRWADQIDKGEMELEF